MKTPSIAAPESQVIQLMKQAAVNPAKSKGAFSVEPVDYVHVYLTEEGVFLGKGAQLLLAWVKLHTCMLRKSPYAVNSKGKPLTLEDAATELKKPIGNVREWATELVDECFIRLQKGKHRRVWMISDVLEQRKLRKPKDANGNNGEQRNCDSQTTDSIGTENRPSPQEEFKTAFEAIPRDEIIAEATLMARRAIEKAEDTVCLKFGQPLPRRGTKTKTEAPKFFQLNLLEDLAETIVSQVFSTSPTNSAVQQNGNSAVQTDVQTKSPNASLLVKNSFKKGSARPSPSPLNPSEGAGRQAGSVTEGKNGQPASPPTQTDRIEDAEELLGMVSDRIHTESEIQEVASALTQEHPEIPQALAVEVVSHKLKNRPHIKWPSRWLKTIILDDCRQVAPKYLARAATAGGAPSPPMTIEEAYEITKRPSAYSDDEFAAAARVINGGRRA